MSNLGGRKCVFCSKSFGRPDVLRRHYERCPLRCGQPIPDRLQVGRRNKACDECARSKLACDAEFPCETCLSRGIQCPGIGAARQSQDDHLSSVSARRFLNQAQVQEQDTMQHGMANSSANSHQGFKFLLKYTNPMTTSLLCIFGIASWVNRNPVQGDKISLMPDGQTVADLGRAHSQTLFTKVSSDDPVSPMYGDDEYTMMSSFPEDHPQSFDAIFTEDGVDRTSRVWSPGIFRSPTITLDHIGHGLIDDLIHYSTTLPTHNMDVSPNASIDTACLLLLSGKTPKFFNNYFERWNHHSPVIHRAFFNVTTSTKPLLLSVLLMGALLSADRQDVSNAVHTLDIAEGYIFDHDSFRFLLSASDRRDVLEDLQSLGVLQAALTVVQAQLRNKSWPKREHTRQVRFSQLIHASRNFVPRQKDYAHQIHSNSPTSFDWQGFSMAETRIRLMCGIFNLEASFSIFFDIKPRLLYDEMTFDLPCNVEAYLAPNADDCFQSIRNENTAGRTKVSEVLDLLCEESDDLMEPLIRKLNILHLFVVILGFLQSLWLLQPNSIQNNLKATMFRGLRHWKQAWDNQTSQLSMDSIERYGFSKDAAIEFWRLAEVMLMKGHTRISHFRNQQQLQVDLDTYTPLSCHETLKFISGWS